ncbi:NIA3 [Acrasis kona]|uniref:NIA3 n=1 Tax=Acrasis kona TaxID=1008807 RepID=A0AAW2YH98_9EUKA
MEDSNGPDDADYQGEIMESDEELEIDEPQARNIENSSNDGVIYGSSDDEDEDEEFTAPSNPTPTSRTTHSSTTSSSSSSMSSHSNTHAHLSQYRAFTMAPPSTVDDNEENENSSVLLYSDDEENNVDTKFRNNYKKILGDRKKNAAKPVGRKKKNPPPPPIRDEEPIEPESPMSNSTEQVPAPAAISQAQPSSITKIYDVTSGTLLYQFVTSCTSDESIRRDLIRDYELPHWAAIRDKYNIKSSARKGRWSEHEVSLIKKYSEAVRGHRIALNASVSEPLLPDTASQQHLSNLTHIKHFLSLIIGRGYDSFEIQWGRIIPIQPGENFCENIKILKELYDKEMNVDQDVPKNNKGLLQRSHEEDVTALYNQLVTHMRLYQQCVIDLRSGKKQDVNTTSLSFKELSALINQHLDRVTAYQTMYNEQLHELLWKCTFSNSQTVKEKDKE